MKRFFLLLFPLFVSHTFAQVSGGYGGHTSINDNTSRFDIGIQWGPAMTSLRGNEILTKYHHPAITLPTNLFVQYNFRKILSIDAEAGIIRIASNMRDIITFTDVNGNIISIEPIRAKAYYDYYTYSIYTKASLGKRLKYSVGAGVYSSGLRQQITITDATSQTPEIKTDYTNWQKKNDSGILFGAGVAFPARPTLGPMMDFFDHLVYSVDVYDHLGLINVSAVPVYNNGTIMTNALQLRIGIAYRFFPRYYIVPC